MAKVVLKFTIRASIAHGGGGRPMAVSTPFLPAQWCSFTGTTFSISRCFTAMAAKKGGDNIGFSGHKKVKGDKVVAFCDRQCNVIAPFVSAPGNYNESPLLREALPEVMRIARVAGIDLHDSTTVSTIAGRTAKPFSIAA